MKILISYLITNFELMKKHWENNSINRQKTGTNKPIGKDVDLGGLLTLLDWRDHSIIKRRDFSCPSGFDFSESNIYVCSMRDNEIHVLDSNLNTTDVISNGYFNDLHSLKCTENGLHISSTGLDCILELDFNRNIKYQWWAIDNGFETDQLGNMRKIDKNKDHREVDYPTLYQTTHVNSVLPKDNQSLLATLFHQGCIIEINKDTNHTKIIANHMNNPHSLNEIKEGYIVSDTKNNRALVLNKNFDIKREINGSFDWVQDSILLSNGNYMICDANNCRIVEINKNNIIKNVYRYDNNWRIYSIKEVPE